MRYVYGDAVGYEPWYVVERKERQGLNGMDGPWMCPRARARPVRECPGA